MWIKLTRMGNPSCACPTHGAIAHYSRWQGMGDFWNFWGLGMNTTDMGYSSFGGSWGYRGVNANVGNAVSTVLNNWVYVTTVFYNSTDPAVFTQGGMYFNGVKQISASQNDASGPALVTQLKKFYFFGTSPHCGDCPSQGYLSAIQMYNRGLSDAEVLQNYNALKGRFGL
jgi:hypothetical protein